MVDFPVRDDDAMLILGLLEAPRDEADLDAWLSGTMFSYCSKFLTSYTCETQLSMAWNHIYRASLAGDLHSSPSSETNVNHQVVERG